MADYVVRDNSGRIVGRISEAGPGCVGCLGISAIAIIIWIGINAYQFIQARRELNRIEAQRVKLTADTLDSYAGQYDYNGRYVISIERRGDQLFSRSPEERCELLPVSETDFLFFKCLNGFGGKAKFVRDGRGQVSLQIFYRDGREDSALRIR